MGEGTWGDGSLWNAGELVREEVGLATLGQTFDVHLSDRGNIKAPVTINSWALHGFVEGYR